MAGDLVISTINGGPVGVKNALINGNFGINQRAVSGTVVLSAGSYGHDRWKAGSGGCTYTFATSANVTTITISAGTLMQVIEGANLLSGTYVLSWTGTATGRVDSGSYGASGLTGTAVGGTNQTIEFSTGTLSKAQYEPGAVATSFDFRSYGQELSLCQRYYSGASLVMDSAVNGTTTVRQMTWLYTVPMRTTPTLVVTNTNGSPTVTAVDSVTLQAYSTNTTTYMGFTYAASAEL